MRHCAVVPDSSLQLRCCKRSLQEYISLTFDLVLA